MLAAIGYQARNGRRRPPSAGSQARPLGSGGLDFPLFLDRGRLGGALDYQHHIPQGLSAFAQVWAATQRDALDTWRADYGAIAGLRWRW